MKDKILILAPTTVEIEPFMDYAGSVSNLHVVVSGISLYKTAFCAQRNIELFRPEVVILAGIAGAYPDSKLETGKSVLVGSEYCADLGSFSDGKFTAKFAERYMCPYIPAQSQFAVADSNSVSAAGAPFLNNKAQIENMEGAAFFFTCLQMQVKFLELRTISNIVGADYEDWNISLATAKLSGDLIQLIDEIKS